MKNTIRLILCIVAAAIFHTATAQTTPADGEIVIIAARITLKDGCERAFMRLCRPLIEQTRREKGCLRYELYRDPQQRNVFFFYEEYAGKKAQQFHSEQEYMDEYRRRREPLLAEPPSTRIFTVPSGKER